MWSRSPLEWSGILAGDTSEQSCRVYHSKPDDFERWQTIYAKSPTAKEILAATESVQDFFRFETDLGRIIPGPEWQESFYSMKLGFTVPGVPAMFIYFSKRLFDLYRMCNLLGPLYPRELAFYMGKQGYFTDGYTPLDALRTYVYEDFSLVTPETPIVKCGQWYEAYLEKEDMICALPLCVGSKITREDCTNIMNRAGLGLCLHDKPIATLGGLKGVSNSVYDIRGAL